MRQILWGLFKKIVIADNCAFIVNDVYYNYTTYSGSALFVGAIFFAFQIYGDFSGYSDIAIGTSRLFGFNLMKNFAFPYFSRDIAEFWRRWHISLSTWFRDYLYIPLGGSRGGNWMRIRNTFAIFLVSGFWHGANWTYLFWGFLNALYFLPLLLGGANRNNLDTVAKGKLLPSIKEVFQMGMTFLLTVFAWIFFRASSITEAITYIENIFTASFFTLPTNASKLMVAQFVILFIFVLIEWIQRDKEHALEIEKSISQPFLLRWTFYTLIIFTMVAFYGIPQEFIYFQF